MTQSYWPDDYAAKKTSAAQAVGLVRPGQRVFVGSGCGEPQALVAELAGQSRCFTDLEIMRVQALETTSLSAIAHQSQCTSFNLRSFYLGSAKPKALAQNKRFITPINLSALPRLFLSRRLPVHVALIQLSPPDDFGWMSLGIGVDVTLAAAQAADLVIAQVNPRMPRVMGRGFLHVDQVDVVVEHEEPLITVGPPPPISCAEPIAQYVAGLIDDGATLQLSLGSSAQALLKSLADKSDLGVHTQFIARGILELVSRGVVTNRKKGFNDGKLVASAAIGDEDLYEFLHDNPGVEFHPSDYVNNPAIIARHNKMTAVNMVMAMDLGGQAAADALSYNHYTGVNGIMDFVRGAMAAPDGKSILTIPSTTLDGKSSRIVPELGNIPVVVPRGDVQYVVTEFGVVNLFGKSLQERALALISIAHPRFREELFERAKQIGLVGPERALAEPSSRGVYPRALERAVQIGGQKVLIRPAKPVDERLIQEHFYGLSREDVVRRFMHEKTAFLRHEVDGFTQVDYRDNLTMVAVIGESGFERVIGVGAYFLDPAKGLAEVAYSVSGDWQKKGLSTILQAQLARAARENGISGMVAYTSPGNQGMIQLFAKLGAGVNTSFDGDCMVLSARFDQPAAPAAPRGDSLV